MNKGIIIYAFKKVAYGKLAYNLAVSIKAHSPQIPVCVLHDELALAHLSVEQQAIFDIRIPIDHDDLYDNETVFTPGKAKISGYKYFPFENTMIIDADSLCLQPLEPLFERCKTKNIYAQTVGTWDETADEWTCQWMALKTCKEVFELPEKYRLFEINSSFMHVRKSKEAEQFYAQALKNYHLGNRHPKLTKWGGGFPDELAMNMAFAQCGIAPNFDDLKLEDINNIDPKPVYFSTNYTNRFGAISQDYYFLGMYGGRNFTSKSLQDYYDRCMRGHANKFGFIHQWKAHLLMKHKHHSK